MLQCLTGLAALELRSRPEVAAEWLTIILSHPATTNQAKERAGELMEGLQPQGGSGRPMERVVDEILAS